MTSQFERKHWVLIYITLTLSVLVMASVGFMVKQKQDARAQLQTQFKQKQMLLKKTQRARLAGTDPVTRVEREKVPKEQQLDAFILNLGRIEQATGVAIADMTFSESAIVNTVGAPAAVVQKLKQIDFKFNLVAPSKQKWLSFLQQLEQQPRTTIVRTISYARPSEPAVVATSDYEVEVAVSTFYMVP